MCRARYLVPLVVAFLGALAFALSSCGGSGSSGPGSPHPPMIFAELDSFPPGAAPAGYSSASVNVFDFEGELVTNAVVKMNGVDLAYDAYNEDYESNVVVVPGATVTVSVTLGGATYSGSATQFTSYPTISTPAPSDTWDALAINSVTWSGGAPTANAEYVLGVLDAADPNGALQWPSDFLQEVPLATTSVQTRALDIPAGNRLMIVGISAETPITGAAPGSTFVVGGFNYVPITVTGLPVTRRSSGAALNPNPNFSLTHVVGALSGVVWSGSQFVAVGSLFPDTGMILTSPDGATWTSRNPGTSSSLTAVASSGSVLVTVGQSSTVGGGPAVLSSTDGISWTERASGVVGSLSGVAWSGTQFVAVGSNPGVASIILTSPDGVTWTSRPSGMTNNISAVTWSGSQFVAVGDIGLILTSSDGKTWTQQNSTTTGALTGVASSGALIVAVGPGADALTSPDGVTWTQRSTGGVESSAVAWSGAQFVAVGTPERAGTVRETVVSSPDGVTWTKQAPVGDERANPLLGIAWSGTRFVMVGAKFTVLTSP